MEFQIVVNTGKAWVQKGLSFHLWKYAQNPPMYV